MYFNVILEKCSTISINTTYWNGWTLKYYLLKWLVKDSEAALEAIVLPGHFSRITLKYVIYNTDQRFDVVHQISDLCCTLQSASDIL